MKRAQLDYFILPVVLDEDAPHLHLDEGDIAQIVTLLLRDPTAGVETAKGLIRFRWRGHDVYHRFHIGDDGIRVYLFRIKPAPRPPNRLAALAPAAGRMSEALIRDKVNRLLYMEE
ncbi:hypothetical protein [Rhodovulum euryhalinum]|uniref:Uncharacterized protein n=1 Tax=Rhodovulum euryhalinum TaxID=35805 RepID=A0A4R2KJ77_9RHOB|nr:hypothetical protein [Rhodovulum euryhalinum]TCO72477.1 hypothetical protein EV655_104165 [Rhodovulum euryhalinum]